MWTEDKKEHLETLIFLLNEIDLINNGTNCLQRIQRCIDYAIRLKTSCIQTDRESFIQFLISEANKKNE